MAQFYPEISDILLFTVKPTEGELTLLRYLEATLDDSYEVYFNPYLNGDRPDIIILRKGHGALVIEVKDWQLEYHYLDQRKKWHIIDPKTNNDAVEKSPIDQVLKYKENLFDLHIDDLLSLKIQDIRNFSMVGCAIYFHNATDDEINNKIVVPFKDDRRWNKFLSYNVGFIGKDTLTNGGVDRVLSKFYINASWQSRYFTDKIYANFKRVLTPTAHMMQDGHPINYDDRQREIINRPVQLMRVKGVFGSGKTTVLAARAVSAYTRLKATKRNPKVLILTYNLTLRNFIHDKLRQVPSHFIIQDFVIINYHQFINAELNNMGIDIEVPDNITDVTAYLDSAYYSNERLFKKYQSRIVPYDAVLIDEIQDYKRSWMNIVKDYFLTPNGEYMIFGDVKQNIYGNPIENKDVVTNVPHRPTTLSKCYRSDSKIRDLTLDFQKILFGDKYELDDFGKDENGGLFANEEKEGYINYIYLSNAQIVSTLYTIVRENILNRINNVSPNDITVLGYTTPLLREFDLYYRLLSREKTKTMFEVPEIMYRCQINYIKDSDNEPRWFFNIHKHLWKKHYPQSQRLEDWQKAQIRNHIAVLMATSEIYLKYPDRLEQAMREKCKDAKVNFDAFMAFLEHYKDEIVPFRATVNHANYDFIRKNKKMSFWMNCGMMKVSTIHSFKGWESQAVFLIVENEASKAEFNELLYTGITRARENLVIINFGNNAYNDLLKPLFDKINKRSSQTIL